MAANVRRLVHRTVSTCIPLAFFAISACSGGYYTADVNGEKKVYRVDEHGAKTLVYETDQSGKTTIYDADDPMAKRQAAAQEVAEQLSAKRAEQREPPTRASKRHANDPIYVNLVPPVLDAQMEKAERSKGAVAEQIRSEFETDPIIKLVEESRSRSGLLKPHAAANADVEVLPKVSLKEAYGVDRKTGKPSKMLAVVFEATITTQVPPATYNVSESGHVLRNLEVSKRFAKQVKQVILEKIGPTIPAH
ncbi:MAG: hypothetical protein A4E19_03175 [Nitrospira sp. SG-bin1]|nr:MAG: hypothetical protein A4E19_03175 [Nitrospira sp. SG-bin1]